MASETLERGRKVRTEMMGSAYVEASLEGEPFDLALQEVMTEFAYGMIWTRPGLSRRDRSMITIAMLCALNRPQQLTGHIEAAIRNGLDIDEVKEIFLHAMVYCGAPAAVSAFKLAEQVLGRQSTPGTAAE